MDDFWKTALWQQYGAAIDMLGNAIDACPDELWRDRSRNPEFWYLAYHTLFFLDLSLSGAVEGFHPPEPFTLDELDPAGVLPERPYTKEELRGYLQHGRRKCKETIESLTEEAARRRSGLYWVDVNFTELLLYNLRHVQHHAAQLNLILRQTVDAAPRWVGRARED
jgi:hypothetical protein